MEAGDIQIKADLVLDDKKIPIEVRYNSQYSLLIRFYNGFHYKSGMEFDQLSLNINSEKIDLGQCRLFIKPNIDGYAGHLTFVNDVYDLKSLIYEKKVVKLQSAFLNLPLVLSYKQKIKQSFKDYTANLNYDLNVYKNLFDELDREYSDEPEEIKDAVQMALLKTEGRRFMEFLDEKLAELAELVTDYSREETKRHGFYFRKQLWNIILSSTMMKRTNLKPRGYAGDSEMMRLIYLNDYQGDSTFSKIMHKHPMEHPAAEAVRNRRKLIVSYLGKIEETKKPGDKIKILSVACGPAFEIQDVIKSASDCKRYHFTLLDQDRSALYEAATLVDKVEGKIGTKAKVDYLNKSVRTVLSSPTLASEWGRFDFIYSLGLFDYLSRPVAKSVLSKLFQLLKPGGELVIGNYHAANPSRVYMEYWLDWVLYYRTEEEFLGLVDPDLNSDSSLFFEETGCQMFLHLKKPVDVEDEEFIEDLMSV